MVLPDRRQLPRDRVELVNGAFPFPPLAGACVESVVRFYGKDCPHRIGPRPCLGATESACDTWDDETTAGAFVTEFTSSPVRINGQACVYSSRSSVVVK